MSYLSMGIAVDAPGMERRHVESMLAFSSICLCTGGSKPSHAHPRGAQALPPAPPLALPPSLDPTEMVPQANRKGM